MTTRLPSKLATALCVLLAPAAVTADLNVSLGETGLESFQYGTHELLANGTPEVLAAYFVRPDETVYAAALDARERSREAGAYTIRYDWGRVTFRFTPGDARLDMEAAIELEPGQDDLGAIYLQFAELVFPEAPRVENRSWLFYTRSDVAHNLGGPGVLGASWADGLIAFCNEQIVRPLAFGLGPATGENATRRPVLAYTGRHPANRERFPWIDRRLNAGGRDRIAVSLRVGQPGQLNQLAADRYRRFAEVYPYELEWEDRRPIGRLFLSSAPREGFPPPNNPRGWFNMAAVDTTTEAGREDFRAHLMRYAEGSIDRMQQMNAQGMLAWDIEGQEHPHQISFLGDPRSLPPEMDAIADEFFQLFRDAGLRTGITLRPQQPIRSAYGDGVSQQGFIDRRQLLQTLSAKVNVARKRWGCTLFYIDSDVYWYGDPFPIPGATGFSAGNDAQLITQLARQFPDCLFMPEWEDLRQYAVSAPYTQLDHNRMPEPPEHVRMTYPEAFFVNNVNTAGFDEHADRLTEAVRQGTILFFDGWWDAGHNRQVKAIYDRVASTADAATDGTNGGD